MKKSDNLQNLPCPLLSSSLTAKDWQSFQSELSRLEAEFEVRRRLLLTRLSASVRSFLWAERAGKHKGRIMDLLSRAGLDRRETMSCARVMAASQVGLWDLDNKK